MPADFESDVFIDHVPDDVAVARDLARRLMADGLRVRFTAATLQQDQFEPAEYEMSRALQRARTLVTLLPAILGAAWGEMQRHSIPFRDSNLDRQFIPVRLTESPAPDHIRQFASIDWSTRSDEEYARLLKACRWASTRSQKNDRERVPVLQPVRDMRGHSTTVSSIAMAGNTRRVVSGSRDGTLKIWNFSTRNHIHLLSEHKGAVIGAAITPDDRHVISGSVDGTLRIWELRTGSCVATIKNSGGSVIRAFSLTPDGQHFVTTSDDRVLRLWDLANRVVRRGIVLRSVPVGVAVNTRGTHVACTSPTGEIGIWNLVTGELETVLEGHKAASRSVAYTPDGSRLISCGDDSTVRIWHIASGDLAATLEGHTSAVECLAISRDGQYAVSGSRAGARVWELVSGLCMGVLETSPEDRAASMMSVGIGPDGRQVFGGLGNGTLVAWDIERLLGSPVTPGSTRRYTNAKVILVGDSGVGKTGLAIRLTEDRWHVTESTHGMRVSQLQLPTNEDGSGLEREVWLWDFAGQPDYRLVSQLSMDDAAMALLVFDPQDDNPFETIGYWSKALTAGGKHPAARILVAGRYDRGGITISRKKIVEYCEVNGFCAFITTEAKSGKGCEALKQAIANNIPWQRLPWTATTRLFKRLKDAIVQLKAESAEGALESVLVRLSELRQRLLFVFPDEPFTAQELRAVVGLLAGQGVIQTLAFGDFVLLQPERLNEYASAVVRAAREHSDEIGCVRELDVLEARLDFKDMVRLQPTDEKILLRAMTQTFLDRSLCLRQETPAGEQLVFPSYFNRDKPDQPDHPGVFVTYGFKGALDEIYSTLVVRLNYSDPFELKDLWKYAADFLTPQGKRVGLKMAKKTEGAGEITVYFEPGVPDDTQVSFIKYIHTHLLKRADEVTRIRTYVCPQCHEPVEDKRAIQMRLARGLTDVRCAFCDHSIPLLDLIEQKFASSELLRTVNEMDQQASVNLDNESLELILVGHAFATAGEAGQIFRPTPNSDWGIDGEIEFKDAEARASGQRVYLQLKSGDSYLYERKSDGKEVFRIRNPRHAEYWQQHAYPVMLVIRNSDGRIRWMNISAYLRTHASHTATIEFHGEPFTALNLMLLRDRILPKKSKATADDEA